MGPMTRWRHERARLYRRLERRHGYGMTAREYFPGVVDVGIGGGTAVVAATIARAVAPPGTWWARRAGTVGAVAGSLLSFAARQPLTGIVVAVLVGGTIELIEAITSYRATSEAGT